MSLVREASKLWFNTVVKVPSIELKHFRVLDGYSDTGVTFTFPLNVSTPQPFSPSSIYERLAVHNHSSQFWHCSWKNITMSSSNGHRASSSDPASSETHPLLPSFLPQSIHPDGESGRNGFQPVHFFKVLWQSSNRVSSAVNLLWPFSLLAIIMHFATKDLQLWVFAISYIGMIPAANLLGFAGQEFARKMPKVSGILIETTFGSIVEIVLFLILIIKHKASSSEGAAEHGNLIPIIQAAVLGSILTNLLLCLGLCFVVGGIRLQVQKFHAAVSEVGNGLLLVAGFGLLIPSAFYSALKGSAIPQVELYGHHSFTDTKLEHDIIGISRITSILLIIAFAM